MTRQVNTPHPDGSLTLCNAAVQRLLDFGVLHYTDEGFYVGKFPQTNKPSLEARWCGKPISELDESERLEWEAWRDNGYSTL